MKQLSQSLDAIYARAEACIGDGPFARDQKELLHLTLSQNRQCHLGNPLNEPLANFHLILQAWGRECSTQVEHMGCFLLLFLLAADLLDDVQDNDLEGKSHATAGAAVASNNAIALLFLSWSQLQASLSLEISPSLRDRFLELFHRSSLNIVAGQHLDLTWHPSEPSQEQIASLQQAKTASLKLIIESAALLAGCDDSSIEHYRIYGEAFTLVVQIFDDIRDVFGKDISPDLRDNKPTYLLSCFLEQADSNQKLELQRLRRNMPESIDSIRQLFYDSGAIASCAEKIEECRLRIHSSLAALDNYHAAHRTMLDVVDSIANMLFVPASLAVSEPFWRGQGPWHEQVRQHMAIFVGRLAAAGLPPEPELRPWHQPQWMYHPESRTIYYPDLEQQAMEILPFQFWVLGCSDYDQALTIMRQQLEVIIAHEMFHFWRHQSGVMTSDSWHEEWVSNRLVVAYLRTFNPDLLVSSLQLSEIVLAQHPDLINATTEEKLGTAHFASPTRAAGYEMDDEHYAIAGIELFRRLASNNDQLSSLISEMLSLNVGANPPPSS